MIDGRPGSRLKEAAQPALPHQQQFVLLAQLSEGELRAGIAQSLFERAQIADAKSGIAVCAATFARVPCISQRCSRMKLPALPRACRPGSRWAFQRCQAWII